MLTRRSALTSIVSGLLINTDVRSAERVAGPPLWVAEHGPARVYFLGQMPVRADSVWLSSAVQQAFDGSTELWTENPEPAPGPPPAPPVSAGPKLSEVVTPQEMSRLRALLVREGLAANALDSTLLADSYPAVSWLQDHAMGVDYTLIPERVLRTKAKAAGKSVHSEWASMQDAMGFESGLPKDVRRQFDLELFRRGLDEAENLSEGNRRLAEWQVGSLAALDAMDQRNRRLYPILDKLIGADRNKAWTARTASIMARTKSAFVCVGIGHLLGPASIQRYLLKSGVTVRRV
jgi:uncharacterized protein YbaP (TraB family)